MSSIDIELRMILDIERENNNISHSLIQKICPHLQMEKDIGVVFSVRSRIYLYLSYWITEGIKRNLRIQYNLIMLNLKISSISLRLLNSSLFFSYISCIAMSQVWLTSKKTLTPSIQLLDQKLRWSLPFNQIPTMNIQKKSKRIHFNVTTYKNYLNSNLNSFLSILEEQ